MSKALILFSAEVPNVSLSAGALELKEQALDLAASVTVVNDADQQQRAVEVQTELKRISKLFEQSRVDATTPLLTAQRVLKAIIDKEKFAIDAETNRIGRLSADFQMLQEAKRRAAEAAQKEELEKAERERQLALSKAQSHEELNKVNEDFCRKQAEIKSVPVPTVEKAKGQIVAEVWEVDGINEWTLLKARPDLVRRIEFDMVAIKKELELGRELPGVKAHKEVKSTVRLSPSRGVIEV